MSQGAPGAEAHMGSQERRARCGMRLLPQSADPATAMNPVCVCVYIYLIQTYNEFRYKYIQFFFLTQL